MEGGPVDPRRERCHLRTRVPQASPPKTSFWGAGEPSLLARGRYARLPRGSIPSGVLSRRSESESQTSHSGGAAPDSHRLPFDPPAF